MNAANRHHDEIPELAPYVDAVLEQPATREQERIAQQRLMKRLGPNRGERASRSRRVRYAWAAAAVATVMLGASLAPLLTGGRGGTAFAAVQKRFQDFQTLQIDMSVSAGGRLTPVTQILLDDQGHMRMNYGERLSYVFAPQQGVLLQLLHPAKRALRMQITPGTDTDPEQSLEWLEDLRQFKGRAERVPGEHEIDGKPVTGYRLNAGGQDMVLWATGDGEPVRLEMRRGSDANSGTRIQLDFRFDRPLDPGTFSLDPPAGYRLGEAIQDAD